MGTGESEPSPELTNLPTSLNGQLAIHDLSLVVVQAPLEAGPEARQAAFPARDLRVQVAGETVANHEGEAASDEVTKQVIAVAVEAEVSEKFLAGHHVTHFERRHDLAELRRAHLADITGFQCELDVVDELVRLRAHPLDGCIEIVLADEVVRQVNNVRSHFYLLQEISRHQRGSLYRGIR